MRVDIARGRVPYIKKFSSNTVFLTAYIEYLFFEIGKRNVASIIFRCVAVCYALGLVGIYFLTLHFAKEASGGALCVS